MKPEVEAKVKFTKVVKKLWGYITRNENRVTIKIVIKMKSDDTTNTDGNVDVKVQCMTKGELIDAIAASAKLTKADAGRALDAAIESTIKLRTFKAIEPEP